MADKKVDWNAIRSEYIGGGISQRALAKKHDIKIATLLKRANIEKWGEKRQNAQNKSIAKVEQSVANVAADNATIALRIKQKLLKRIEKEIDALPEDMGTETYHEKTKRTEDGAKIVSGKKYRLNDLAQSYKALVGDMPEINDIGNEVEDDPLTQSLKEFAGTLEKGEDNADK